MKGPRYFEGGRARAPELLEASKDGFQTVRNENIPQSGQAGGGIPHPARTRSAREALRPNQIAKRPGRTHSQHTWAAPRLAAFKCALAGTGRGKRRCCVARSRSKSPPTRPSAWIRHRPRAAAHSPSLANDSPGPSTIKWMDPPPLICAAELRFPCSDERAAWDQARRNPLPSARAENAKSRPAWKAEHQAHREPRLNRQVGRPALAPRGAPPPQETKPRPRPATAGGCHPAEEARAHPPGRGQRHPGSCESGGLALSSDPSLLEVANSHGMCARTAPGSAPEPRAVHQRHGHRTEINAQRPPLTEVRGSLSRLHPKGKHSPNR